MSKRLIEVLEHGVYDAHMTVTIGTGRDYEDGILCYDWGISSGDL